MFPIDIEAGWYMYIPIGMYNKIFLLTLDFRHIDMYDNSGIFYFSHGYWGRTIYVHPYTGRRANMAARCTPGKHGTRCIGLMSKHGGKIYLPQERTWQHKMSLPLSKCGGNVYFEQTWQLNVSPKEQPWQLNLCTWWANKAEGIYLMSKLGGGYLPDEYIWR